MRGVLELLSGCGPPLAVSIPPKAEIEEVFMLRTVGEGSRCIGASQHPCLLCLCRRKTAQQFRRLRFWACANILVPTHELKPGATSKPQFLSYLTHLQDFRKEGFSLMMLCTGLEMRGPKMRERPNSTAFHRLVLSKLARQGPPEP